VIARDGRGWAPGRPRLDLGARVAARGKERLWTASQQALFDSPYHLTVAWGSNGVGKSLALAELARRAIAGQLPWQIPGNKYTVLLAGNTELQLSQTIDYLWEGLPTDPAHAWFGDRIRLEGGSIKGQRVKKYDVTGGPGRGGRLILGTFKAKNLAGHRADVIITDEPAPEGVFAELWTRLFARDGRMYQTFTPTLGTAEDLTYLWKMVDDPALPWAGQIQTELTLAAVTPLPPPGSAAPAIPWMTQAEIDRMTEGIPAIERDMRLGRSRIPLANCAYFSAWGPHLQVTPEQLRPPPHGAGPPPGTRIGIGIDHGSKPGAQRAVLVAVGGRLLQAQAWVLDEYQGDGRTEVEADGRGIVEMLRRQGLTLDAVDLWLGDRAHGGYAGGRGGKDNTRLTAAIAQAVGIDTAGRDWMMRLPRPLRRMTVPAKSDKSVWVGCEIMHRMMAGRRLLVSTGCQALASDLSLWQGGRTDPHKDGIDALRYIVTAMAEGHDR
jgi:hypothetical protein